MMGEIIFKVIDVDWMRLCLCINEYVGICSMMPSVFTETFADAVSTIS